MTNQREKEAPVDIVAFKAEIEWLQNQLEDLEKPTGISVIKHSSIFLFYMVWIPWIKHLKIDG